MPIVRAFIKKWCYKLDYTFCDYIKGDGTFHIALENNEGNTVVVTYSIIESWSGNLVQANVAFEKYIAKWWRP